MASSNNDLYNMNHQNRGHAIIFNHEYILGLPPRTGTKFDQIALQKIYSEIGFTVHVFNDLKVHEIHKVLYTFSQETDHSNSDCFVITVMTHGLGGGCICSSDTVYFINSLWEPFSPDKCKTLAGKPKILIMQACRGSKMDVGFYQPNESDCAGRTSIPTTSDFLFFFSCFEGFNSWRNVKSGSWLIQSFCKIFMERYKDTNFITILTRVCADVAENYSQNNLKEMPTIVSTLLKDLYFN